MNIILNKKYVIDDFDNFNDLKISRFENYIWVFYLNNGCPFNKVNNIYIYKSNYSNYYYRRVKENEKELSNCPRIYYICG